MKRSDLALVMEIKEYIDNHIYEKHTIKNLCIRFTINREKLQLGFYKLVRSTVYAYIIQQRLKKAEKRLIESSDPVKLISLDCGYKKQRSFNKTFKTIYKMTPATYRKLHQQCGQHSSDNLPLILATVSNPFCSSS